VLEVTSEKGVVSDVTSMSPSFRVFATVKEHAGIMRSEFLHHHRQSLVSCPRCCACGGLSQRAVRTRAAAFGTDNILYLAEVWACSVCGRQWEDEMLAQSNARAADAARAEWIANADGDDPVQHGGADRAPQPSFPKAHFASQAFR
jgi:hypothetical protein